MNWVLDCSFTSALFLPDESSEKVTGFLKKQKDNTALIIPALWWYESTNVIFVSVKRKRIMYADVIKIFNLFNEIEFETDDNINKNISKSIFELAYEYKISSYDATYLELSMRRKAGLATLDNELNRIAKLCGLEIF